LLDFDQKEKIIREYQTFFKDPFFIETMNFVIEIQRFNEECKILYDFDVMKYAQELKIREKKE